MAAGVEEVVQRSFQFCVIDEVDSILIDEARTPLIISGQVERPQDKYQKAAAVVEKLSRSKDLSKDGVDPEGDYEVDEKQRSCILTDEGFAKTEKFLNVTDLFDPKVSITAWSRSFAAHRAVRTESYNANPEGL